MYIYGTRIEYFTCISTWNRLLRVFLCRSYCHLGIWHNMTTLYSKLNASCRSNIISKDNSNIRTFREWNSRNQHCVEKSLIQCGYRFYAHASSFLPQFHFEAHIFLLCFIIYVPWIFLHITFCSTFFWIYEKEGMIL